MRQIIVEYSVIAEDEPSLLEDAVMKSIEDGAGWQPYGPMVVYVVEDFPTLCQPMVRYSETT